MKLKEYLKENFIRVEEFAELCKISPMSIYNYCSGRTRPTIVRARIISSATEGRVTVSELREKKGDKHGTTQ